MTSRSTRHQDPGDVPEADEAAEHAGLGDEHGRERGEDAPPAVPPIEEVAADDLEDLSDEELRDKALEYKALWQRARADYQNARRRGLLEQEAAVRRALQPLLDDCLLVLDHLEMALRSPAESEEARMLAQGVELTRAQFVSVLERNGVTAIPEGGTFDPELHQAMETVPSPGVEPGTIVSTLRRGFRWGSTVLRHAQVRVAADPGAREGASGPTQEK